MNDDFFKKVDWLKVANNHGYGALPIPSQRDEQIGKLLRAWMSLDEMSRHAAVAGLPEEDRLTLLAYSERMATLAVRNSDKSALVLGLVALGLDEWRYDWRDNVILLCLHHDAALRIGVCPAELFEDVSQLLPHVPADGLRSFLQRSEEDKSLRAMGYVADCDDSGFRYRRTW